MRAPIPHMGNLHGDKPACARARPQERPSSPCFYRLRPWPLSPRHPRSAHPSRGSCGLRCRRRTRASTTTISKLFKKRVEAATEGALKISVHVALVEDSKVIRAVAEGKVEMGGSRLGHFADAVPAIGIFLVPFMFNRLPVQDAALQADSDFRRLLDAAVLEKTGTRVLWWSPFGTSIMMSKSVPITSPAAMVGKTVRTYDKISETFVRSCGGIPVYLGGPQQYDGYKTGKAVAGQMGITFVVARHLWDVLDQLADTRHFADGMLILINEQVWRSLPPDHRRIMQEAAAEAQKAILADLHRRESEGYALAAKNGIKIYADHTR